MGGKLSWFVYFVNGAQYEDPLYCHFNRKTKVHNAVYCMCITLLNVLGVHYWPNERWFLWQKDYSVFVKLIENGCSQLEMKISLLWKSLFKFLLKVTIFVIPIVWFSTFFGFYLCFVISALYHFYSQNQLGSSFKEDGNDLENIPVLQET